MRDTLEFACPICVEVVEKESCDFHPGVIMNLVLRGRYVYGTNGSEWHVMKWSEDYAATDLVCTVSDGRFVEYSCQRLVTVLEACEEIPTDVLERGYLQTLEALPEMIREYLENPNDLSKQLLLKQLARVEARGKSAD